MKKKFPNLKRTMPLTGETKEWNDERRFQPLSSGADLTESFGG
jgi:hypothetical protein